MTACAGTGGSRVERALGPLAPATEAVFRTAARVRRARAFHPEGVTAVGHAVPLGALPGLPAGPGEVVVRFSRGIGLPEAWPDVLGVSARLVDVDGPGRHHDLLMASSGWSVPGRRLLRPARHLTGGAFSTLLPYAARGRRVLFGAEVLAAGPLAVGDLEAAVEAGHLAVQVRWAGLTGGWHDLLSIGALTVLPEVEDRQLDLAPDRHAREVVPVGALNALRRPAYAASREGRWSAAAAPEGEARSRLGGGPEES